MPERGDVVAERDYRVDEVDLFLFSAACWLPHRIHYDQAFAREEGLEATPIHGPLQATWLVQLADEWATQRGARVASSTIRHLSSAYPRQRLHAAAVVESVEDSSNVSSVVLRLTLTRPGGEAVTTGSATVVTGSRPERSHDRRGCR